jgi:nicotinamide mononucleotide adenylyltransferase
MKKVFIESDRRWYIAEHNDRLQRAWYSYLIDDKWVYRLFKVSAEGKKEWKWVSWIRYETLWRDDDIKHTKNKIVDGYKKVSITEYGQEIPKESEEYYEIMQKIRGKTESEQ